MNDWRTHTKNLLAGYRPAVPANAPVADWKTHTQSLIDTNVLEQKRRELQARLEAEQLRNPSGRTGLSGVVPLASIPESITAQAARAEELEQFVARTAQKFGAKTVDDLPHDGDGLQARLAAGELRKIYGMREPEPSVQVQSVNFRAASPELVDASTRAQEALPGTAARITAEQQYQELAGGEQEPSAAVTFAKSAAGAIPEMITLPNAMGPQPEQIAESLYGRGAGEIARQQLDERSEGTLASRFAEAVAISPEEEAANPVARTAGTLAMSLPLGMIGPSAGLTSGLGIRELGKRMGTRGIAVAIELAPQALFEASLGIESGQMTPEEAAQRVATQVAIGFAAGGALEGVGARRGVEPEQQARASSVGPVDPQDVANSFDPHFAASKVEEALGAQVPQRRISLDEGQKLMSAGAPEAEVQRGLQDPRGSFRDAPSENPMVSERLPNVPDRAELDRLLSQVEEERVVADMGGPKPEGPGFRSSSRQTKDGRIFHTIESTDGGRVSILERDGKKYLQRIERGETASGTDMLDRAQAEHGDLESYSVKFGEEKGGTTFQQRTDLEGASRSKKMAGFVDSLNARGRVTRGDQGQVLFPSSKERIGQMVPPGKERIGGGLPAAPIPTPTPKIINENLNTERLDVKQEALQQMYDHGRIYGLDIHMARGPKRSLDQVEADANKILGSDKGREALLSKPLGSAYTDAEGFALRQVYAERAQHMADVNSNLRDGKATQEDMARAMDSFYELEMKRTSAAAESGRSLNAHNMVATGQISKEVFDKLSEYIASTGRDPAALASLMKKINPKTLKILTKPQKAFNAIHEWWLQSLVSGSHALNVVSTTAEIGVETAARRPTAALLDVFGGKDRVRFGEVAEAIPRSAGIQAALKNAWEHYKTGVPQSEAAAQQKVTGSALPAPLSHIQYIGTRALGAEDEVFALLGYQGEISALSYRKAASEGLSGDELKTRMAAILQGVADGTEDAIHRAGIKKAERLTFRDDTILGKLGGRLANVDIGEIMGLKTSLRPMRWVIPFTRVGSSIVTNVVEHSPVGFATIPIRRAIGEPTGRRLSEDLARPVVGTLMGITGMMLRDAGLLTGDRRTDSDERNILQSQGWLPNAIRIGKKFISIETFGPVGSILLSMANAVDMFDQGKDEEGQSWLDSGVQLAKGVASDTWFKSLNDLLSAFEEKDPKAAERFTANLAAGFVPNVIRRGLRETGDTTTRQSQGFTDQLGQQIGLKSGEPRLDAFGREQGADRPTVDRLAKFFGVPMSTARVDPIIQEHMRLGIAIAPTGTPQDTDEVGKKIFDGLSKEEQLRFSREKGAFLHEVASDILSKRKYQSMSDEQKAVVLRAARNMSAEAYHEAWRNDPADPSPRAKSIIRKSLSTERKTTAVDFDRFAREVELFEGLR